MREALGLVQARRRKPVPRVDPSLTLAVARVGGNLNQLARWINGAVKSDRASNIDASVNKWSYSAGVVSFADSDQPSEDAQQEAIGQFEALAFAGLEADQYDCLWVRHVHEGDVELHFCTPPLGAGDWEGVEHRAAGA